MPRKYFDNFPEIRYDGYRAKNITTSAKLINKYANLPYAYDLFEIDREQRPDLVAHEYYGDPYMTWMIFYANKTLDPYYDWYLSEDQLKDFIIKKYGSIEYANRKILYFRTNWYSDDRELSPSQFTSMFSEYTHPHSLYWNTVYSDDGKTLISYVRKQTDMITNTNKILRIGVSNSSFDAGDIIVFKSSGAEVGSGEVESTSNGYLSVINVIGTVANGYSIQTYDGSGANSTITSYSSSSNTTANTWTITNISDDEYVYWTPYTVMDKEIDDNEAKRLIKVVDPNMAIKVADRLEDELSGRT